MKIASLKGCGRQSCEELLLFGPEKWCFLVRSLPKIGEDRFLFFFFFLRSPVFGQKNPKNFRFRPEKPFKFGEDLFFFFFREHLKVTKNVSILFKTNEYLGQVRLRLHQTSYKTPAISKILVTLLVKQTQNICTFSIPRFVQSKNAKPLLKSTKSRKKTAAVNPEHLE